MLLSALGFSACDKGGGDDFEDIPLMYGPPTVHFAISGKVTDSENRPIKGIQVSALSDTIQTNSDGEYTLNRITPSAKKITVKFTDVDKEENGSYEAKAVEKDFKDGEFSDGRLTVTADVKLTEKENTEKEND